MATHSENALALLTVSGLLWLSGRKLIRDLLILLPQIELCLKHASPAIIEASNWAYGFMYHAAALEKVAITPPSVAVLDHLLAAWFRDDERTKYIRSVTLETILTASVGNWIPQLTEAERSVLRAYLKEQSDREQGRSEGDNTAGLVGLYAGGVFSDEELRTMLKSRRYFDQYSNDRLRIMLERIGLSGDRERDRHPNVPTRSSQRRVSRRSTKIPA